MTTNFLEPILERKRARLEAARVASPLLALRQRAKEVRERSEPHALRRALKSFSPNIIAEFKRASPSKGTINEHVRPAEIAKAYQRGGAVAISVLTEEDYFHGSLEDVRAVRGVTRLPILRKDFIVDEYQIYETAAAGADAVLLIVAALNNEELARLRRLTEEELGLDALVEVHTEDEMKRAQRAGATLIGVNNRNLQTFKVSLDVSERLARQAAPETILVSESGLNTSVDLRRLHASGYRGFLIGESLMRAEEPAKQLQMLIREGGDGQSVRVKVCGITNVEDALAAVRAGADMLGFNFYKPSPRHVTPERTREIIEQLPPGVLNVGVFVNQESPEAVAAITEASGTTAIQLHGEESLAFCDELRTHPVIKALRVRDKFISAELFEYQTDAILLDTFSSKAHGGTGETFAWSIARDAREAVARLFLAGGLTPENVSEAVRAVRPYAVDVCSSVESSPGHKDERRVGEFIAAAKNAKASGTAF
jgi:indole-3-glycerol phosphate synthase/phosphoribosylanthranilate isomerase/anthranilate synthase/indole-3-glycerol phosphate synthase/phosphoribosylanthranilate isomerase